MTNSNSDTDSNSNSLSNSDTFYNQNSIKTTAGVPERYQGAPLQFKLGSTTNGLYFDDTYVYPNNHKIFTLPNSQNL